jgi:predicted aconitase
MLLTDNQKRMLDGDFGSGTQMSMNLLNKFGEAFDAERMIKADVVHLSTNIPTDLLEKMTEGVKQVRTTCSLHAVFDPKYWRERFGLQGKKGQLLGGIATADEADIETRLGILKRLGFLPTFTCLPYASGIVIRPGDVFIATGSSGQIGANSIFAARATRESTSTALAAAVTGATPEVGLLKKENRRAQMLIRVDELNPAQFNIADYGALGHFVGEIADMKNVAIEGLPPSASLEECKSLTAPIPLSGSTTLCHVVGVTPEAPTLEAALMGKKPEDEIDIGKKELQAVYDRFNNSPDNSVDVVAIGCPHCTISELKEIATLLDGKRVAKNVKLLIGTSDALVSLARVTGCAGVIEGAGAVISNCCVSAFNPFVFLGGGARVVATNSARGAHYIQKLSKGGTRTFLGDTKNCIHAAVTGKYEGGIK